MASSYDDLLLQNTKLLSQNEADSSSFVVKTTVDLVAPEPPESKVINIALQGGRNIDKMMLLTERLAKENELLKQNMDESRPMEDSEIYDY